MISKKYRVPSALIPYILEKGNLYTSKLFIIRYRKNDKQFARYRVIISKKLHPKAVTRNHLRRQIYESIRLHQKNVAENRDIILIPKKRILKTKYSEIEADIINIPRNGT